MSATGGGFSITGSNGIGELRLIDYSGRSGYDARYVVESISFSPLNPGAVPPTVSQLAGMAGQVYHDPAEHYVIGDYHFLRSFGDRSGSSLYAEAYISNNSDGSKQQIVIAVRGSDNVLDYVSRDTSIYANASIRTGLELNMQDVAHWVAGLRNDYGNADFTFTGHSLGGAVAENLGSAAGARTISFNAPGTIGLFNTAALSALEKQNGSITSSDSTILSLRSKGDGVSHLPLRTPFGDVYSYDVENVNYGAGACAILCHSMPGLYNSITSGAHSSRGISSDDMVLSALPGIFPGTILADRRVFDIMVSVGEFALLDPQPGGSFLQLDLNDSTTWISGITPTGLGEFTVFGWNGQDWLDLGIARGLNELLVSNYPSYRVYNSSALASDANGSVLGVRFASDGRFTGSLKLNATSAVPETTTWGMFISGFGFIGVLSRIRRRPLQTISLAS